MTNPQNHQNPQNPQNTKETLEEEIDRAAQSMFDKSQIDYKRDDFMRDLASLAAETEDELGTVIADLLNKLKASPETIKILSPEDIGLFVEQCRRATSGGQTKRVEVSEKKKAKTQAANSFLKAIDL